MLASSLGTLKAYVANNEGLLFVMAAEGFFALMNLSVKILGEDVSVLEVIVDQMTRLIFILMLSVLDYVDSNDNNLPLCSRIHALCKNKRSRAWATGHSYFALPSWIYGILWHLWSLVLVTVPIPLDAIVLTFLTPLCSAAVGSFLLKEKFTMKEVLAGIVSLVGVVLIARPPFIFDAIRVGHLPGEKELSLRAFQVDAAKLVTTRERMVAVGVALLGVAAVTCEYNILRVIGKRAHPFHNIVYLSSFSVIASSFGYVHSTTHPASTLTHLHASMAITQTHLTIPATSQKWPLFAALLLLVTLFGLFAQICMILGFQREAVGRASTGVYSGIIFALILGRVVFGTVPGALSVIGIVLILGSAVFVVVMKQAREGEESSSGTEGLSEKRGVEDVEVGLLEMAEVEG
ncbi:hypothetical protein F5887DRAFT_1161916 [Amanita rubescens]|nr:hypothetical protein F5887DRAFT_1161916 [Amanita rubescens]